MVIRTQDKCALMTCNNLFIKCFTYQQNPYVIIADDKTIIARYSSKEKALKVLDLIEKTIGGKANYYVVKDANNSNTAYEILNNMYTPMVHCKNGVFQMPLDEDVVK